MLKHIVLTSVLIIGCANENSIHNAIPHNTIDLSQPLDIIVVLDASHSMRDNIPMVVIGLGQVAIELRELDVDWQLVLVGADPTERLFETVYPEDDVWYEMAEAIGEIQDNERPREYGFSAAQNALEAYPMWFRDTNTMVIFISDEKEQSGISVKEFRSAWPYPLVVASAVGPYENPWDSDPDWEPGPDFNSNCSSSAAPKYHDVSDYAVDICSREPWNMISSLVRPEDLFLLEE